MNEIVRRDARQEVQALRPKSYGQIVKLATMACESGMVPKAFQNEPHKTAIAMMMLAENDLPVITGLKYVAVINGQPAFYSDAVPGIARKRGLIRNRREWFDGAGESLTAHCEVVNSDGDKFYSKFGVAEARRANLWGKDTYKQYPERMLMWRARSYAIRDAAPDAFMGPTVEELEALAAAFVGPDNAKEINPPPTPSPLSPQIGPQSASEARQTSATSSPAPSSGAAAPAPDGAANAEQEASGIGAWRKKWADDTGLPPDHPLRSTLVDPEPELSSQEAEEAAGPEVPFPTAPKRRGRRSNREIDAESAAELKERAMAPDVDEMALDLIYKTPEFERLEIRAKDLADEVIACVEQSRRELPELPEGGEPYFGGDLSAEAPEADEAAKPAGKPYKMIDQNGSAFDELPAYEWLQAFSDYIGDQAPPVRRAGMLKNNRLIIEDIARDHPELEARWQHVLGEARR